MPNIVPNVQECDARGDDSSNIGWSIIILFKNPPVCIDVYLNKILAFHISYHIAAHEHPVAGKLNIEVTFSFRKLYGFHAGFI